MIWRPSSGDLRDDEPHATLRGELEGVRQQVLQHLLQTLRVGHDAATEPRVHLNLERQTAILRVVLERADDHLQQVREEDFFRFDGDGARLDLRQIENVGDEVEEIGAGAVNRAGKLDLLGCEVALWVV